MVARRKKSNQSKPSVFIVAPLVAEFLLISLGNFLLSTLKIFIPKVSHGRGRPRKSLAPIFYFKKLRKAFFRRTTHKSRNIIALVCIVLLLSFYTFLIFQTSHELPSPERLTSTGHPQTTEFYDRDGKLLYRLYENQNRTLVKIEDLPSYLIQATIATEDKNFYKHFGFDPVAITRAFYHNIKGDQAEGASTITQQLVKNTLLTPEKTISRKIREVILAFWAERIYTKDQILQMYFNEAPYGGPIWGIEAASQSYFGKHAKELTLPEAAFLAGLPASPTNFSPYGTSPELAKNREAYVLSRMVDEGYLTADKATEALNTELVLKPDTANIEAPHFVYYVKDLLDQRLGERVVSQGGLRIQTTLDSKIQAMAEESVKNEVDNLAGLNVKNGAAMITDAKTGQILAMVGSRDYHYPGFGNYNVALSLRQPGSSIKPVTYATAFRKGFSPGNTILDTPVNFRDEWGNSYAPQNYDGTFHGPVSVRTALGSSLNIPAVRILATVGVDSMVQTARDMGITTFTNPKNYGLALTLGGAEVRMIEMMGVYNTFSQMGTYRAPTPILKVTDSAGNVLDDYQDSPKQAIQAEVAYLITNILSDNKARALAFGLNSLLNISPNVAVKTGTTDNKRDNWTFGYSSDYVVGVWVGNPDNTPMNPALTSGVTGAAPIWSKIMKNLIADKPANPFSKPPGVAEVNIDGRKDFAIAGNIPKSLVRMRVDGDSLVFSDNFGNFATPSAQAIQ